MKSVARFLYGMSAITVHWAKRPFLQGNNLLEQQARFIDEDEEGEGEEGAITIFLDPKWLVDVFYSIILAKHEVLNGLLRSESIAGLWGLKGGGGGSARSVESSKKNLMAVVGYPEVLCHRIFEALESFELVWTDFSLSEQNEQFIRKANSLVPTLFPMTPNPSSTSPGWLKFINYVRWEFGETVGLPKPEDINLISSKGDTKKKTSKRKKLMMKSGKDFKALGEGWHKDTMGSVKFERWWMFRFLPPGIFPLLMVRLLDSFKPVDRVGLGFEEAAAPGEQELLMTSVCHWRNGLILSSTADKGKTFMLIQVGPCSEGVSNVLRKRDRAKDEPRKSKVKSSNKGRGIGGVAVMGTSASISTTATGAPGATSSSLNTIIGERNPWKDVILQVSVWERDSPLDVVSTFAQAVIMRTLRIIDYVLAAEGVGKADQEDAALKVDNKKAETISYSVEIPCLHCVSEGFAGAETQTSQVPVIFSYKQVWIQILSRNLFTNF